MSLQSGDDLQNVFWLMVEAPICKIYSSNWIIFPNIGVNMKHVFLPTTQQIPWVSQYPMQLCTCCSSPMEQTTHCWTNIFAGKKSPKAEVLGSLSSPFCIFSSTLTCHHQLQKLNGRGNQGQKKKNTEMFDEYIPPPPPKKKKTDFKQGLPFTSLVSKFQIIWWVCISGSCS